MRADVAFEQCAGRGVVRGWTRRWESLIEAEDRKALVDRDGLRDVAFLEGAEGAADGGWVAGVRGADGFEQTAALGAGIGGDLGRELRELFASTKSGECLSRLRGGWDDDEAGAEAPAEPEFAGLFDGAAGDRDFGCDQRAEGCVAFEERGEARVAEAAGAADAGEESCGLVGRAGEAAAGERIEQEGSLGVDLVAGDGEVPRGGFAGEELIEGGLFEDG